MSQEKIVDIVFQKRTPPPLRRGLLAALCTLALYVALVVWALQIPPKPPSPPKPKEYLVELEKPTPPAPPPPKPPDLPPPTPTPTPVAPAPVMPPPVAKAPTTPPPPAQAAKVVAAAPDPAAPVDLSDAFVTGDAAAYAGGVTTSGGTNDKAVHTPEVNQDTPPAPPPRPTPKGPDRSRPVSLDEDNWSCAWPKAADEEQIDEQAVILKVSVDAKGKVSSAHIVSDPGHGFGAAAIACALKTRFTPALDSNGEATAATSPPIRVRFTR